jgi:hypothetical protein
LFTLNVKRDAGGPVSAVSYRSLAEFEEDRIGEVNVA